MDNRNILVLTTLSCLIAGFIGPLVIWLSIKEKFADGEKAYLLNLLNFELTLFLVIIVLNIVNIIPILGQIILFIGGGLILLLNTIIILVATLKLTKNENYKFPFCIELLK